MYKTKTSRGWIGILTDGEVIMENEKLDNWFDQFIKEHEGGLSPHVKTINRLWFTFSTQEKIDVRSEVIRRVAACKKAEVSYIDAVRGIFVETDNAAVRVQPDKSLDAGREPGE